MCPVYYFLLLMNLAQSPNEYSFPMPKSKTFQMFPNVSKCAQECQKGGCPSQAWALPFKGRSMFTLTSMVISSIIMEVIHMYVSIVLKLL